MSAFIAEIPLSGSVRVGSRQDIRIQIKGSSEENIGNTPKPSWCSPTAEHFGFFGKSCGLQRPSFSA
jgi:hypothetical protein